MIRPVGGPEHSIFEGGGMPKRTPVGGPGPGMGGGQVIGTFKKGGEVPMDGNYKMHKGEKVLTKEQTSQLKHSFGLAQAHLAHDAAPEPMHKQPRKKIKEVSVRHAKGGHVA